MGDQGKPNAEILSLHVLKALVIAAENHHFPTENALGPCGGCDVLKPGETAEGACGGCDLVQPFRAVIKPLEQAGGPCGGCDQVLKPPIQTAAGPCGGCDVLKV